MSEWGRRRLRRGAEDVARERDGAGGVEGEGGARDLGGVEVLVLVGRHRGVEVRDERGERELVRALVRRREEVAQRARDEADAVRACARARK